MIGRSLTRLLYFEPKQHTIGRLDLGDRFGRKQLVVVISTTLLWVLLMYTLFGWPSAPFISIYITLPGFISFMATLPAKDGSRRWRLTQWVLKLRFVFSSHKGVVNGEIVSRREDMLRFRERVSWEWLKIIFKKSDINPWMQQEMVRHEWGEGPAIEISQRAVLASWKENNGDL